MTRKTPVHRGQRLESARHSHVYRTAHVGQNNAPNNLLINEPLLST